MAQAPRDQNRVPALLGVLNSDGVTPTVIKANPSTHVLMVEDNSTGTSIGGTDAVRDQNRVPVLLGVSSADGKTPVPIYANSSGALLIQST